MERSWGRNSLRQASTTVSARAKRPEMVASATSHGASVAPSYPRPTVILLKVTPDIVPSWKKASAPLTKTAIRTG